LHNEEPYMHFQKNCYATCKQRGNREPTMTDISVQ
ncbi:MAG: hypothetical protein ACJAR0_004516, partial [Candidatus Azotimanducaceae bacterium]